MRLHLQRRARQKRGWPLAAGARKLQQQHCKKSSGRGGWPGWLAATACERMGEKKVATPLPPLLQPIACQLIAHASLITGRQYVHSLLLMGNERAPFGPAMLGSTCDALQTWRGQQVPGPWVGDGRCGQ